LENINYVKKIAFERLSKLYKMVNKVRQSQHLILLLNFIRLR